MGDSEIVRHKFSKDLNEDELIYRQEIQPQEPGYDQGAKWIKRINDGRRNILPILYETVAFRGEILELGAGSCWFASELSRLHAVNRIYCLDMSEVMLNNIAPLIMKYLNADTAKIVRVVGDFNDLHFEDKKFDYVVFDSSLHHIQLKNFNKVLSEVRRVLKDNGKAVAIREPFLIPLPFVKEHARSRFALRLKEYGVTENIFTKSEWMKILLEAGFRSDFIPYGLHITNALNLKNLIKRVIRYSPLRKIFFYFRPDYLILLKKIT